MEQNKTLKIGDVVKIVKKRRWALIIPAFAVFLLSVVVIAVVKPVYRSTSTILIEEREIPPEYVMSSVTSYAEQRLQQINQRIMSSSKLLEIIDRFNLYADKRNKLTTEEIVDDMRKKDIKLEPVSANVVDPRSGRPTEATIAFTVSYEGHNPQTVQQVANVLASLYMEENMKVVGQQTAGTTKFLDDELKSVRENLVVLEKKIAAYKEGNPRALPELFQYNLQTMDGLDKDYDSFNDQLRTLREKESSLQTELATQAPDTTNEDKDRLKELRVLLIDLKSKYSDEYPDVKKTTAAIAGLEKKLQSGQSGPAAGDKPDNPAYIALTSRLSSVQTDIKSVKRQIEELEKKRDDFRRRLEMSPRVEEVYINLEADRRNTQAKYDELMKKYMESQVASGLEKEQMGERFTLIDPARLPEKPVSPNRSAILLIGFFLGIGSGMGTVALQEYAAGSARRAEDLAMVFPFAVLAEIPQIITLEDELRKKRHWRMVAGIAAGSLVVMLAVIHFFVMDLDVLAVKIARKLPF